MDPIQISVEDYLAKFQWDTAHYAYDKALAELGALCLKAQKSSDDQVKQQMDKINGLKNQLVLLTKKKGSIYTQIDLADKVYENSAQIKADQFVNSHYQVAEDRANARMTTVLVAVHQKRKVEFEGTFWKLLVDFNMAAIDGWERRTEKDLIHEYREVREADFKEKLEDWEKRVALRKKQEENERKEQEIAGGNINDSEAMSKVEKDEPAPKFQDMPDSEIKPLVKDKLALAKKDKIADINKHPSAVPGACKTLPLPADKDGNVILSVTCMREDINDYIKVCKKNGFYAQQFDYDMQGHLNREEQRKKIGKDLENTLSRSKKIIDQHFSTVFKALVHIKIMRVFIDSVLRFGLPRESRFFMGIIKPAKGQDSKIFTELTNHFAEEHLKEFYGEKQEA